MLLNFLAESGFDERTFGDSFERTSTQYKIELNQASYGTVNAFDQKDFYTIKPGIGDFELDITTDPSNGFTEAAFNVEYEVRITDSQGTLILSSSAGPDDFSRYFLFRSAVDTDTYYVEISNPNGKAFSYVATLRPFSNAVTAVNGTNGDDTLTGTEGADSITAAAGNDSVTAGLGADSISDSGGSNYLRGDAGNDVIEGGSGFDDINGNMGNDTCNGGLGDDWVVGGKDDDFLVGGAGDDLVYGNLGDDICGGSEGNDIVRGGQGDDLVVGGAGNDYVSGDRGNDTVSGGAGADLFHTFGDAGMDRVLDFKIAEGDRVLVDPGTTYTLAQVGDDTVISMGGGGQMVLVGVSLASLPDGWIFGA